MDRRFSDKGAHTGPVFFTFGMLSIGVLAFAAAAAQEQSTPIVSFSASQARYLSTESAQGSLEINNMSDVEVGYNPTSVSFLIREPDGRQHEQRWITSISHLIPTTIIPPGERRDFSVPLPSCDVISDPCTARVAIKLSLWAKPSTNIPIVTREVAYTFVPDPTATFRIDGLRGGRPLFITQGEASDSVPQDRLRLEFRFVGGAPQDVDNVVGRILTRHGLPISEVGGYDDLQFFEATMSGLAAQTSAVTIDAAIDDIKREYGNRAQLVSKSFVPDANFGFERVFNQARDTSLNVAERLARFTATTPLSGARGLSGDGMRIQIVQRSDDEDWDDSPEISYQDLVFNDAVKQRERARRPDSSMCACVQPMGRLARGQRLEFPPTSTRHIAVTISLVERAPLFR